MDDEIAASPNGLLQCLRMLSEEAASLRLTRTFAALQEAATICRAEAEMALAGIETGARLAMVH